MNRIAATMQHSQRSTLENVETVRTLASHAGLGDGREPEWTMAVAWRRQS